MFQLGRHHVIRGRSAWPDILTLNLFVLDPSLPWSDVGSCQAVLSSRAGGCLFKPKRKKTPAYIKPLLEALHVYLPDAYVAGSPAL